MTATKYIYEMQPVMTDDFDVYSNRIEAEKTADIERFSFFCGSKLLEGNDNNVISPLSLYFAFSMLCSGADEGRSKNELLSLLHAEDSGVTEDNCKKLFEYMYYREAEKKNTVIKYSENKLQAEKARRQNMTSIANSLWMSDKLHVKESYSDLLASNYYASLAEIDFCNKEAAKEISKWVENKTNGLIKPALAVKPDMIAALINTLYFYSGWEDEFDPQKTSKGNFTRTDGTTVEADFMTRNYWGYYAKNKKSTVISLDMDYPYEMRLILPDEGIDYTSILEDADAFSAEMKSYADRYADITLKLPKFDIGSSFDLMEAAGKMGLENAFKEIAYTKISDDLPIIDSAIHEAKISADEKGIEGAAMTFFGVACAGIPRGPEEKITISFDRPFMFGIHDYLLNTWLFLGVCSDPQKR